MTTQTAKKMKKLPGINRKKITHLPFFPLAILFLMLFFLRNAALAKAAVLAGLERAALGVLPSVFPFLVLAGLLTAAGGLPDRLGFPLARLFCLPPAACAAILSGWICGFPIGAVCIAKEVERARLTKKEGERAVAAASVPSPAFSVGVVGIGLFGNARIGFALWLFCLLSAAIVCAATGQKEKKREISPQKTIPSPGEPFFTALTGAVAGAASVSLHLCAFIAFFSVLIAAVQAIFTRFGLPSAFVSPIAALLELSAGIASALAVPTAARLPFCAAACGWAGFSVHLQIFSVCRKMRLSTGKYLLAKALQALLCAMLGWIFLLVTN